MVKIETIKKDLERYFTNKDGKKIPLEAQISFRFINKWHKEYDQI